MSKILTREEPFRPVASCGSDSVTRCLNSFLSRINGMRKVLLIRVFYPRVTK